MRFSLRDSMDLCKKLAPTEMTDEQLIGVAAGLGILAHWWTNDLFRRVSREKRIRTLDWPTAPSECGSCWIVFVQIPILYPALSEGLVLPLQWRKVPNDDECLPESVRNLAKSITDQFDKPEWTLHRHAILAGVDFRDVDIPFRPESGWAPLAAGLLVAACDGAPDPLTWATGVWDGATGLSAVDQRTLSAKLQVARNMKAKKFFVPQSQQPIAQELAPDLDIHSLSQGRLKDARPDPMRALERYTLQLEIEPQKPMDADDEERFAACVTWYERHKRIEEDRGADFYHSNLLPTIIERTKKRLQKSFAEWKPPRNLVAVVSALYPFVPLMLANIIQAQRCLLLYTLDEDDNKQERKAIWGKQHMELDGVKEVTLVGFNLDPREMNAELGAAVDSFRQKASPDGLVFDITSGTSLMKFYLSRLAKTSESLVCVSNESRDGDFIPGYEFIVPLEA